MLADFWVVFPQDEFLGRRFLVLFGHVKVAGTGRGNHSDLVAHFCLPTLGQNARVWKLTRKKYPAAQLRPVEGASSLAPFHEL
jgi:hypothetical protein